MVRTLAEAGDQAELQEGMRLVKEGLECLREANRQDSTVRSRELSTAITYIETGGLWLTEAERVSKRE